MSAVPSTITAAATDRVGQLKNIEAARHWLTQAVQFDEVLQVKEYAERARLWAKQAHDTELIEKATEIKVRAERKAGEMLRESAQNGQRARSGVDLRYAGQESKPATLEDIGITKDESARYQKLAAMPQEAFEAVMETAKAIAGEVTTAFVLRAAKAAAAPAPEPQSTAAAAPIDELPAVPVSALTAATRLFQAIEVLATLPYPATVLHKALPHFQHHHVTDHIDAAIAALSEVKTTWTQTPP